jgi:hypothetical protein
MDLSPNPPDPSAPEVAKWPAVVPDPAVQSISRMIHTVFPAAPGKPGDHRDHHKLRYQYGQSPGQLAPVALFVFIYPELARSFDRLVANLPIFLDIDISFSLRIIMSFKFF